MTKILLCDYIPKILVGLAGASRKYFRAYANLRTLGRNGAYLLGGEHPPKEVVERCFAVSGLPKPRCCGGSLETAISRIVEIGQKSKAGESFSRGTSNFTMKRLREPLKIFS
jgi:hypothetical protein